MADYTAYGRWLKDRLAQYRIDHHLKIDAGNHNRCERHDLRMERDRVGTGKKSRYSCPACLDQLAAYGLTLRQEWEESHRAPNERLDVECSEDAERSVGSF